MDLIILNLMLMPHTFGANASNLVLMPKKNRWWRSLQFYFFLNHVLCKTRRTQENLRGEPLAFSYYILYYQYL
jgi:hypothetical protein